MDRTGVQTVLYLTCTMISSVDLGCYRVSGATKQVIQMVINEHDISITGIFQTSQNCKGRVAQSIHHLTRKSELLGSIPGLATYFPFSFR